MPAAASLERTPANATHDVAIDCKVDKIFYGNFLAVRDSAVPVEKGKITGFIGPSGCGKSTVLRSLNRMNDLVKGFRLEGKVNFLGQDIYAHERRSGRRAAPYRDGVPAAKSLFDEHFR